MRAAIVLGDDFHVLVKLSPAELVLDADVGEMHLVIEVREVVFVGPAFDLALVPIRPAVAVRPAAVRRLQPLLILALELGFEDDAPNVSALLAQPLFLAQVGTIDLDIVRQLAWATDARVEGLLAAILTIPAVCVEQMLPTVGQRDRAVAAVELHRLRQPFIAQVAEVWFACVLGVFTWIAQVTFSDDAKRANGRERAAVVAVQFVAMVAVEHDLPFTSTREVEALDERASWIISRARVLVAMASIFVTIAPLVSLVVDA